MDENEIERRIVNLIETTERVLLTWRSGRHPTEAQLNAVDGAILALNALKTCGHTIREDCDCLNQQAPR